MVRHFAAAELWGLYGPLPRHIRDRAKQFALLKSNPQHPSLQFKKIGQRRSREIWAARVTINYRALAFRREDGYLWFWIGPHKTYDVLLS